ncbi:tetratricopeptide repeat protein [Aquimarina hainanensis]|uniref:tetratricopeptide repeat protein n=1 Tax=Aquimarina hainanensis TaxID=1578017 RepID=UPI003611C554
MRKKIERRESRSRVKKKIEEERKASLLDKQIQQAVLSLELGEYNKSVVHFEKIRKEHPDNSSFMKPYAEALMYTDNIKQAMPILESLLHQTPEDIRLNTLYAQALYRKQFILRIGSLL